MLRLLIGSIIISISAISVVEIFGGVIFHIYRAWLLSRHTLAAPYQINHPSGNGNLKVLVIGDSIGVGVGSTGLEKTVHYQILNGLSEYRVIDVDNLSVSGSIIGDLVAQAEKAPSNHYDLVIISAMANDVTDGTELDVISSELSELTTKLRKISKTILWFTPASMRASYAAPYLVRRLWVYRQRNMVALLRSFSEGNGLIFVDLVNDPLSDRVAKAPDKYYAPDYFHPNDLAYKEAAEVIVDAIRYHKK